MKDTAGTIWKLCQEMAGKKDWYGKVFNPAIIEKWRVESKYNPLFDIALKLLQASAQGVVHSKTCYWDTDPCRECQISWRKQIEADPKKFGLEEEDLLTLFDESSCWWWDVEDLECPHIYCGCKSPDCMLGDYIEYLPKGVCTPRLHQHIKEVVQDLAKHESLVWHPDSKDLVRDIVHPSMYCYVRGVSRFVDGKVESKVEESLKYQWLPSEFEIKNNKVKLASYINNLDAEKHPKVVPMLEMLLGKFLPSLEKVMKQKLPGNIQVIVKIGQILLTPEKPVYPGGSWHIEGMPYEHIAATAIHYLETDGMTESFLEFRKPTIIVDDGQLEYEQGDSKYSTHHYGITKHYDGTMNRYLGLIKCSEGSSVIFPNTLQHRVKEFMLLDKGLIGSSTVGSSTRTMVAFFIIDPKHRIISTKDIPPQQTIFTKEEAEHYQSRLMYHRKFFVDSLNKEVFEREYSLCEH